MVAGISSIPPQLEKDVGPGVDDEEIVAGAMLQYGLDEEKNGYVARDQLPYAL